MRIFVNLSKAVSNYSALAYCVLCTKVTLVWIWIPL